MYIYIYLSIIGRTLLEWRRDLYIRTSIGRHEKNSLVNLGVPCSLSCAGTVVPPMKSVFGFQSSLPGLVNIQKTMENHHV